MHAFMRKIHLYAGLLWLPWMLVYATSGFFINHGPWFKAQIEAARDFEFKYERQFTAPSDFPRQSRAQAEAILAHLGMSGNLQIQGHPDDRRMTFNHPTAGGTYRIIWHKRQDKVEVRRQPFTLFAWVNRMHFKHGYQQESFASDLWAVLVDLVMVSMWLWVFTGIYLWWKATKEHKKKILGAVCLAGGLIVFAGLAVIFFG